MDRPCAARHNSFAPRLVVLAKRPIAGAVKTRLAGGLARGDSGIGTVGATRFYRTALRHTLVRLGTDPRWQTYLAVSPGSALMEGCWPSWPILMRVPQGSGDLGARMQGLFDYLPPGPAILVGSDIPGIRPAHIAAAFRRLGQADAVFGPATDGGYWLVGLKRAPRRLAPFKGVPWSSAQTLAATCANLKGSAVALTSTLSDVDTAADFCGQRDMAERLIGPAAV